MAAMSRKSLSLAIVLCVPLALLISTASTSSPQDARPCPQWEYLKVPGADPHSLEELGAEGWELVALEPAMQYVMPTHAPGVSNVAVKCP